MFLSSHAVVRSISRLTLILTAGLGFAACAHADNSDRDVSKIDINFAQKFEGVACAANVLDKSFCLSVTGAASTRDVGAIQFKRTVFVNPTQFDPAHPTCLYGETVGTLNLPRGTLNFHAPGNICFTEGIASYNVVIIGGTGAYAGALGGGKIIVPPPETFSSGRELWHLELFKTPRNDYRFED